MSSTERKKHARSATVTSVEAMMVRSTSGQENKLTKETRTERDCGQKNNLTTVLTSTYKWNIKMELKTWFC